MSREIRDKIASIRGRLQNVARENGRDFDAVLLLYMQERLLYRLSQSRHRMRFILKMNRFLQPFFSWVRGLLNGFSMLNGTKKTKDQITLVSVGISMSLGYPKLLLVLLSGFEAGVAISLMRLTW